MADVQSVYPFCDTYISVSMMIIILTETIQYNTYFVITNTKTQSNFVSVGVHTAVHCNRLMMTVNFDL